MATQISISFNDEERADLAEIWRGGASPGDAG